MTTSKKQQWEEVKSRIKGDQILLDFANPFPKFIKDTKNPVDSSIKTLSGLVGEMPRPATIQFNISKSGKSRYSCLFLSPKNCEVIDHKVDQPDLEFITSESNWLEIANGNISMLEVFVKGEMRVQGDLELARIFARRISKKKK